jgi:hypothetical protein
MYRVVLGNPTKMKFQWQKLCEEVRDLFLPIIKHKDCTFDKIRVNSTMEVPSIASHDLLIYVFQNSNCSPVSSHFSAPKGKNGCTAWGASGTGSEVYVRGLEGASHVAKLIFHEAMHNKLHKGESLHAQGGLASEIIYPDTALNDKNIESMAKALSKSQSQWTGGWDMINDPLSPLLCG